MSARTNTAKGPVHFIGDDLEGQVQKSWDRTAAKLIQGLRLIMSSRKGRGEVSRQMEKDVREEVMVTLQAKFPVLKKLFSIRKIGIYGEFAHGDAPENAVPELAVEFEHGGDTYRNYIGLAYYLDGLLGREVSIVTRRMAEDFISDDVAGEWGERKRDRECLTRMQDEVSFLLSCVKGHDLRTFSHDDLLKRAAIRSLEVLGDCALQVSASLKREHPEIPWTELAGLRLRLVHPFFGPDWVLVWDVLTSEIPRIDTPLIKLSSAW
jgi:uncharacterized protein with HEPN domain/predicted nucleotidyltransferase